MKRKGPFHAFAVRDTAHGERLRDAAASFSDHDPFKCLQAGLVILFGYLYEYLDGIAYVELRGFLLHILFLDKRTLCHLHLSLSLYLINMSGRFLRVLLSAIVFLHCSILLWSPDNNISGTFSLLYSAGLVY